MLSASERVSGVALQASGRLSPDLPHAQHDSSSSAAHQGTVDVEDPGPKHTRAGSAGSSPPEPRPLTPNTPLCVSVTKAKKVCGSLSRLLGCIEEPVQIRFP